MADFIDSYKRGETKAVCGLFEPRLRQRITARLAAALPHLRGRSCATMIHEVYGDPRDQPPAVDEASNFKFEDITVRGEEATIGFPDGRRWRLVSSGRRWLIAELPFLPFG